MYLSFPTVACTLLHADKFYNVFFSFNFISNCGRTMLPLLLQGHCNHLDHLVTTATAATNTIWTILWLPLPPFRPPHHCCHHPDHLAAAIVWTTSLPPLPSREPCYCHHHLDHLATATIWTTSVLPPSGPPHQHCCHCLNHLISTAIIALLIIVLVACTFLVHIKIYDFSKLEMPDLLVT